jgi:hypothetical protein
MSHPQPKEVTAELERQAWKLRMRCWSHEEIADKLGVTPSAVSRMLKRMGDKLTKAFQEDIHQVRAEQTGHLFEIARLALDTWEAAQQAATQPEPSDTPSQNLDDKAQEPAPNAQRPTPNPMTPPKSGVGGQTPEAIDTPNTSTPPESGIGGQDTKASEARETPNAKRQVPRSNAAYLKVALQAYAAIRSLWGMDSPKKGAAATPESYLDCWPGVNMEAFRNPILPKDNPPSPLPGEA